MASCSNAQHGESCHFSRKRKSYLPFNVEEYRRGEFTFPNPFIMPQLQIVNTNCPPLSTPDRPFTCQATDLMKLDHIGNPFIIFGQPFSGKTSLFMKLITKANDFYGPEHWIRLVDLRDVAQLVKTLPKRPKDFMELLAIHLKLPVQALRELFKPLPNAKDIIRRRKYEKLICGELFLDGFDEIPASDRDYFLRLIPQTRSHRAECPIRVWISCRNHLKLRLIGAAGDSTAFEILSYTYRSQLDMFHYRWKNEFPPDMSQKQEDKLWDFTRLIYSQLQMEISDFEHTIGTVPIFCIIIAEVFVNHAISYMENPDPNPQFDACAGMCIGEMLDYLVYAVLEFYCLKAGKPLDEPSLEKEYQRIARMYCRYAIETFPQYECDPKAFSRNILSATTTTSISSTSSPGKKDRQKSSKGSSSQGTKTATNTNASSSSTGPPQVVRGVLETYYRPTYISVPEELYRIGFVVKAQNGLVIFHHRIFGDFFIGKYFAAPDSLDVRDQTFDSFFLRVLLFDAEAKPARSFFDAFLYFAPSFTPKVLHDFLVNHYRLSKKKTKEWKRIADNGNVWHLLVAEGHHRTAQVIIDSFSTFSGLEEMRQFLRMRAPIEIYEGKGDNLMNNSLHLDPDCKQRHVVSTLGILALFGYSYIVHDTLKLFLTVFEHEEIREHFNKQDTWTPVHYAAMHSNLWFILQVYGTDFYKEVGIKPGVFNPDGQLSLHLLMSYSWFHIMVLRDLFYAEYDELADCASAHQCPAAPTTTTTARNSSPAHNSKGKGKGKKGGKRQQSTSSSNSNPAPPPPMASCCQYNPNKEEEHMHYREIIVYRDMVKDLKGKGNALLVVHHACLELMVNNGGEDVNAGDKLNDMTPLHFAAQGGHLDTVRLLLKLKADVGSQNKYGRTALHFAGMYGHRQIFMTLVKNGSKAIHRDEDGVSAIMLWKRWGEDIDLANDEQQPMTIAEKHFFKACYDIDKLMEDINAKDAPERADELQRREIELENDIWNLGREETTSLLYGGLDSRKMWRKAKPEVASEDEDDDEEEPSQNDDDDDGPTEEESPAPAAAQIESPSTPEKQEDVKKECSEQDSSSSAEESEIEEPMLKRAASEIKSDSGCTVMERKTLSKRLRVKVIKKPCDPAMLEGFEELVIEHSRKDSDGGERSAGVSGQIGISSEFRMKVAQRSGSPRMLELEFVGDDGKPLQPTEQVYDEVVNHLSKLLEFQRMLLLPGHRGISSSSSEAEAGPSRRMMQRFKSIRRHFKK